VAIPGAIHDSTIAITNGNYKVGVTDTMGCQSISDIYVLTGWVNKLGVPQVDPSDIRIFPNPAQNVLHIVSPVSVHVFINSIDGKLMMDQVAAREMDISALADGIYIVMLYDDGGQMVKSAKLVKTSN